MSRRALPFASAPPATRRMLIATSATNWLSTAAAPRLFAGAGYDVSVMCDPAAMVGKTRFAHRVTPIPGGSPAVAAALRAHLEKASYDRVYIGDDGLFRYLVESADREWMRPWLCVDPDALDAHRFLISKHDFLTMSSAAGIPVARYLIGNDSGAALRFADEIGYPVVAKTEHGSGGSAVRRIDAPAALLALFEAQAGRAVAVQRFVTGRVANVEVLYHRGDVACYYNSYRLNCFPSAFGPMSQKQPFVRPELLDVARRVGMVTGFHGPAGIDVIVEDGTNDLYVLEVNPRLTGGSFGLTPEIAAHFVRHERASFDGVPLATEDIGSNAAAVSIFPNALFYFVLCADRRTGRAWRDALAGLRNAPWDDPGLTLAYLREFGKVAARASVGKTRLGKMLKEYLRRRRPARAAA